MNSSSRLAQPMGQAPVAGMTFSGMSSLPAISRYANQDPGNQVHPMPSPLSIASLLLLLATHAIAAENTGRFTGGAALSRTAPSSADGRYSTDAALRPGRTPTPAHAKQVESALGSSPQPNRTGARFALSATLGRNGNAPGGALICGPIDDIFKNSFE